VPHSKLRAPLPNNRVRKLVRRRRATDVAGADFACCENFQHGSFDLVGRGAFIDVPVA